MTNRQENSLFALHTRDEILFILHDLAEHHTSINLNTIEGILLATSVLGISEDGTHVYFDISLDAIVNSKILNSQQVTFTTQTGIKLRWLTSSIQLVKLSDGEAFSIDIPQAIERIQRREYFRLRSLENGQTLICKIPDSNGFIEVEISDISLGGLGVAVIGVPSEKFSVGAVLEGCSIEFPNIGSAPFRFKVCGIWPKGKAKSGESMHHIGFEFLDLSRGSQSVIQRHMIQLENEVVGN